MSIGRQLGEIGGSILGTVDDLVDAYGDNAVNAAKANETRIQSAQSQILINEAQAKADIAAKQNMDKLLNRVAYIVLFLVAALIAAQVYKTVR